MLRPTFKSHLLMRVLPPDHLVLLTEDGHHVFPGEVYVRLAKRLDGRLTEDEAVEALELEGVHPFAARLALGHFEALGLLDEPSTDRWPTGESAFWHGLGLRLDLVNRSYERGGVSVQSIGGSHAADLQMSLERLHVKVAAERNGKNLLVVVADDYLDSGLGEVNREQLDEKGPWILVKLVGSVIWIGPLFLPGQTGCWACLAQRLQLNRQTERMVRERSGLGRPPQPSTPWSIQLAAAAAATEIKLWLATGSHKGLEGTVATLDLKDNSLTRHRLTRRPQCPACGTGALPKVPGCCLTHAPKGQSGEGRAMAP
ncbi:MAG TPA: TOMM precursor leader peptide-binding protein, partial [Nitrospiraceae bacterium]